MKRKWLFLFTSALLISFVGIAASLLNPGFISYYYYQTAGLSCITVNQACPCNPDGVTQCFYENNTAYPMFEAKDETGACQTPIKYF